MGRKLRSFLTKSLTLFNVNEENELLNKLNKQKMETDPDFFVGPNGKILPKIFKSWIGKNKRESLLRKVKNKLLINAISELYRKDSFIGDGGTASILLFERRTGLGLGRNGNTHEQKVLGMIKYINNKVLKENLTAKERKVANNLLNKLRKALVK